jgi:uncharacterized protein YqgV (UPF0045/DUF77 family)
MTTPEPDLGNSSGGKQMLLEIQCVPSPLGIEGDYYQHIEAAIAVIEKSGLLYEVGALGTTVEGEPDQIWALSRAVHEATLLSGADSCVSIIKVAQSRLVEDSASIDSLTSKFR